MQNNFYVQIKSILTSHLKLAGSTVCTRHEPTFYNFLIVMLVAYKGAGKWSDCFMEVSDLVGFRKSFVY